MCGLSPVWIRSRDITGQTHDFILRARMGLELTVSSQVTSPGKPLPASVARVSFDGPLGGDRLPGWYRLDSRLVPISREDGGPVLVLVWLRGIRRRKAVN